MTSKSDDKIRPVHERLAQIEGSTTFKDLREGVGGFGNITTHDLMAGLAIIRTLAIEKNEEHRLAPEVLETYFASTQQYRRELVHGYLANNRADPAYICAHRMGATLGAQMMAGITFNRTQDAEFSFICNVRRQTLIDLRSHALQWYQEILGRAIPLFGDALRQIIQKRELNRRMGFVEANVRNEAKAKEKAEREEKAKSKQLSA